MKTILKSLVLMGAMLVATAANASHIYITNPSINGVALDSVTGFTNPTINATVGSTLDLTAGFFGNTGGWHMTFAKASGNLMLSNFDSVVAPGASGVTYLTFSQTLNTAGTWIGAFEPISDGSCPSYLYGNGVRGGGGCGSPSETIGFSLVVSEQAGRVPEPGSLALIGLGLVGFAVARRKAMSA
jgi:hypothetical protein